MSCEQRASDSPSSPSLLLYFTSFFTCHFPSNCSFVLFSSVPMFSFYSFAHALYFSESIKFSFIIFYCSLHFFIFVFFTLHFPCSYLSFPLLSVSFPFHLILLISYVCSSFILFPEPFFDCLCHYIVLLICSFVFCLLFSSFFHLISVVYI